MDILLWLLMGSLAGWIASMIMGTDAREDVIFNIAAGIVGALIGGWLIGALLVNNDGITVVGFGASLIGAVMLLVIMSFLRRSPVR